jgi:hypothetical protein
MAGRWFVIFSFIFGSILPSWGIEPFRTFTASSGQAFAGRVLSYEGQTFSFKGRIKNFIQSLSSNYLQMIKNI